MGPPRSLRLGDADVAGRVVRPRVVAAEGVRVQQAITAFGALGAPGGLGTLLAGPTITVHGTDEQTRALPARHRHRSASRGASCSANRAPGPTSPGSTRAPELDGDEWVVNGQKVWTSGGHWSDLGMLLARTDPDVPKHQGITYFALDMHQPGVEIRPLRELTGRAMFNEVFLTDVRVPNDAAIGGINNGWAVANTTLMFERTGLGAGGGGGSVAALPGTVGGDLVKRAGDFLKIRDLVDGGGGVADLGAEPRRARARQRHVRRRRRPPGPGGAPHHERDRPLHEPAPARAGDVRVGRSPGSATSPSSR